MDKRFHEESFELVLRNIHNSRRETTINMGARRDIHGTSSCLPCQNVQIPPCAVVNIDQTRVHFVPTRRDWTWERKGAKHIQVLGMEDKRQITEVGLMVHLQVVFQGTTSRTFPPMNEGRKNCLSNGFHFTCSSNQ